MKKLLVAIILLSVIIGCKPPVKKPEPIKLTKAQILDKHLAGIKTFKDTVFLGFVLGSSKAEATKHLKKLIRQGKTKSLQTYTLTMLDQSIAFTGHPYNFYIGDEVYDTTFELSYSEGKLLDVSILLLKMDESKIVNFISKKYGSRFQVLEGKDYRKTHVWIKNNTEITYRDHALTYTDLTKKTEIAKLRKGIKEVVTKIGSKETESDI